MPMTKVQVDAMQLARKTTTYVDDPTIQPTDIMTISQAARTLGMTQPGVISLINRGGLTEIIDRNATERHHFRRFVLLSEIRQLLNSRTTPN